MKLNLDTYTLAEHLSIQDMADLFEIWLTNKRSYISETISEFDRPNTERFANELVKHINNRRYSETRVK